MNRIQSRKPAAKTASYRPKSAKVAESSGVAQLSGPAGPSALTASSPLAAAMLSGTDSDGCPHALIAPLHYERNYAYPLVVWLHGPDDNENQLKRIMPLVSLRNYVSIAPRGTAPGADTLPAAFRWLQCEDHIQAAEQRVLECFSTARQKFNLSADRVFLAGYDCGGTMALRVALRHPRQFAGVLSMGGRFPTGHTPLAQLAEARRLPIFVACNRASRLYPTDVVCDDLRLMHSAGMSIVLREYPGTDGLLPQMLADMDRWLMEQVTGAGIAASAPSASSQSGPR